MVRESKLIVYVDDIVVTCINEGEIDEFVKKLCETFQCRYMGRLRFFLGI